MRIPPRASVILATIAALSLTVGTIYLWPVPDPPEVEHRTTGEGNINPDGQEWPIRVHDVDPDLELDVQELLNVRNRTIAVLADGVAGLNYPDGTPAWTYRVPGHDTTVDITANSGAVVVTHPIPGRWFTEQTRETVLHPSTGEILLQEDLSSDASVAPELAPSDVRILNDDTIRGQWRGPAPERYDGEEGENYAWEVEPASWCADTTEPETEITADGEGIYLAISCNNKEGHLAQIEPRTGATLWEQEFTPADGAPEILILRNELRSGPENDPTIPAINE